MATLMPRRASAFAAGCWRALDESTRRSAILHPWAALELGHFVAPDEPKALANARHGLEAVQGRGSGLLRRFEEQECEVAEYLLIRGHQLEVDRNGLGDSRGVTPLGAAGTLGFLSALRADCGPVIVPMGILDRRQACRALAHAVGAASQSITGRTHGGRRARGLGQHAAAEQDGTLWRVDGVMVGLAAVTGLPRARVAQHEGEIFWRAAVGAPIPGAETRARHNQTLTIGGNGLEQGFRSGVPIAVHKDCSLGAQEADIHGAGMQGETTVKGVLVGVEAHEVSSSFVGGFFPKASIPLGYAGGEASIIIKELKRTPGRWGWGARV